MKIENILEKLKKNTDVSFLEDMPIELRSDYEFFCNDNNFIIEYFSCLITTNRRIKIDNILFWDWEDDELTMN